MTMPNHLKDLLDKLPQQHQRQDALNDQLHDLAVFSSRLGMYDAANFIRNIVLEADRDR